MKKYKALIVSGNHILKAVGIVLLSSLVTATSFNLTERRFSGEDAYIKIISENISVAKTYKEAKSFKSIKETIEKTVLGYVLKDTVSIFKGTISVFKDMEYPNDVIEYENVKNEPFEDKYEKKYKKNEENTIPIENQAPIKEVDLKQRLADNAVVSVGNETSYSIDINSMLNTKPKIDMSVMGPKLYMM